MSLISPSLRFFFFNDTATTEIYTLSLHDALPIFLGPLPDAAVRERGPELGLGLHRRAVVDRDRVEPDRGAVVALGEPHEPLRSEEHTSELQSRQYLVCRLLLEKKNTLLYSNEHDN